MKPLKLNIDPRLSEYPSISQLEPEKILAWLIETSQTKIFYHGTRLGDVVAFDVVVEGGIKFVQTTVKITNTRNWSRFNIAPKLLGLTTEPHGGPDTLSAIWFSMGITEKLTPFASPEV